MSWKNIDRQELLEARREVAEITPTRELTTRAAERRAAAVNYVRRLALALKAKLSWRR